MTKLPFVVLVAFAVTGCSKREEAAPSATAKPAPEAAKPEAAPAAPPAADTPTAAGAPAKTTAAKLEKLGLQIDVPGEASVSDDETLGTQIDADGIQKMSVIDLVAPKTVDEEKASVAATKPQNVKTDKLADGWTLTFDTDISGEKSYPVYVQRELGGKAYLCSGLGGGEAEQAAVFAACKTLRK